MIVYIWSERRFCSTVGLSFKIYNILISWIFLSFEIVVFKVSVYVIPFTKMNPITDIFQVICLHLTTLCFKVDFNRKRYNFEIEWMLLKVSCPLFSAVAVCTFKWWMVNLLRNKEDSFDQYRLFSSTNNKRIYENYRLKTYSEECSAWYI